jgi:hypothetical protein
MSGQGFKPAAKSADKPDLFCNSGVGSGIGFESSIVIA